LLLIVQTVSGNGSVIFSLSAPAMDTTATELRGSVPLAKLAALQGRFLQEQGRESG